MGARDTTTRSRRWAARLIGAAALALAGEAGAQTAPVRTPASDLDLGLRGTTTGAVAGVPAVRRLPPTAAPVRPPLQRSLQAPGFDPTVQAPVAVLADPDLPPPPPPRRRRSLEDPYAPLGLRLGGVTLFPAIEQSVGYDTNPNRSSDLRKGSRALRTDGELRIESDWSRHALTGLLRGGYSAYPDVKGANRPDGEGVLGLRLDATRDTAFDLEGRFRLETERPGSPEFGVAPRERPLVSEFGGAAGVTQRFNRLSLGLRGSVDRTLYEDADLGNGVILDQSDRELTQYGLRLRAGYEITPGLTPFVEALVDTRVYDRPVDDAGFRRDSLGLGARVGSTFELTRTLTGEVAVGGQRRDYEDPRLSELRGIIADAALVWSATPLTTVRLRGATTLDETRIIGSSGAVTHRVTLEVQHDLRRNVTLTALGSASRTDYDGIRLTEDTLVGGLRLDYKLTRSVAVRASFTHERLISTIPGADYTANVYLIGLRLQR